MRVPTQHSQHRLLSECHGTCHHRPLHTAKALRLSPLILHVHASFQRFQHAASARGLALHDEIIVHGRASRCLRCFSASRGDPFTCVAAAVALGRLAEALTRADVSVKRYARCCHQRLDETASRKSILKLNLICRVLHGRRGLIVARTAHSISDEQV